MTRQWRSRLTSHTTSPLRPQSEIKTEEYLFDNWFDPIEAGLRDRAREFLQAMFETELEDALARSRYARRAKPGAVLRRRPPAVTIPASETAQQLPSGVQAQVVDGLEVCLAMRCAS